MNTNAMHIKVVARRKHPCSWWEMMETFTEEEKRGLSSTFKELLRGHLLTTIYCTFRV
jgi:hypothetical protein